MGGKQSRSASNLVPDGLRLGEAIVELGDHTGESLALEGGGLETLNIPRKEGRRNEGPDRAFSAGMRFGKDARVPSGYPLDKGRADAHLRTKGEKGT